MRKFLLFFSVIIVGFIFIGRLIYLQIYISSTQEFLDDIAIKKVYTHPKRGYVYDRNGKLLVANQPSYDIMVIPNKIVPLDSTDFYDFCTLLRISKEDYTKKINKAKSFSSRLPSSFVTQIAKTDYAVLQEKMWKYKGFHVEKRSLRLYKTKIGANVLGSLGEVTQKNIRKDPYYKLGDYIGKQGIELSYEKTLRGTKGIQYIQMDKYNQIIGSYKNGIFDTLPIPGRDVKITIDSKLQAYGELLMTHKRGGIVAIEPSSGEIIAMVTSPNYDPNLLVGRERSKNFSKLFLDSINKPTFDRSLQAMYPPGSPFKILNALIALEEGVITENQSLTCNMGFKYGNRKMGCHSHKNPVNLNSGIYESCNAYFANVYLKIIDKYPTVQKGIDNWSNHLKSFGLGNYLNNDLPVGQPGKVPTSKTYDKTYDKRWYATYTLSNAIGQGEVLTTPIQLANMTAVIANRGYFYTPHIVKNIENKALPTKFTIPKHTTINPQHFEPVIHGMYDVYNKGTAIRLKVDGIDICGKTGTVENFTIINGKKHQLTDHSIFVAFAPKDLPKIALAVFVENGYFGSRFAGKIASLMIEKYIKGTITRKDLENFILRHTLEHEYQKPYSNQPFGINKQSKLKTISAEHFETLLHKKEKLNIH